MLRVAQIVTATGFVMACVRPSGPLVAPAGMTFLEIPDSLPEPTGKFWNFAAEVFQDEAP